MTDSNATLDAAFCTLYSGDVSQTHAIAAALARQAVRGDCILLRGDLGSGKTTFARGFIQALQAVPDEVVSPTFTLVQAYPAHDGNTIWHFDLYRLKNGSESAEIGLEEALHSGITLIEWPELVQSQLPEDALDVTIEPAGQPDQRRFTFTGSPNVWQARLDLLKEQI